MRIPGSNLPLPNIVAWSILLGGATWFGGLFIGLPLAWSESPLAYSPLPVLPVLPYVMAVGLVLRRAWITSASLPAVGRFLITLPVLFVLSWCVSFNLTMSRSPEWGYVDDSPFVTQAEIAPQAIWGWPWAMVRIFDEPLNDGRIWLFDGASAFFNLWFICTTLLGLVFGLAVPVAFWRSLERRQQRLREEAGSEQA